MSSQSPSPSKKKPGRPRKHPREDEDDDAPSITAPEPVVQPAFVPVRKGTTTGPRAVLGPNVILSQRPLPLLDINLTLLPDPKTEAADAGGDDESSVIDPNECPWITDDLITVFDFLVQFKVSDDDEDDDDEWEVYMRLSSNTCASKY